MDSQFGYYVFCLLVLIVGFLFVKRVAGCIIRSVVMAVAIIVLLAVYHLYFK